MANRTTIPPDEATLKAANAGKKIDRGILGSISGAPEHKQGNIATFLVVFFSISLVAFLIWGNGNADFTKKDIAALLGSFISLGTGMLIGGAGKGR